VDRLDALRLFSRLAERGSFSAAARDLKIKQSTASKWVAELEAELGASLVERTTRSVRITEDGQRLLARARDVLAAFDELSADFEERSPEPRGRVRVSVPVVFGRLFVVPAVADFLKRHAEVSVELVMNDRYVNLVDEGFDLAIRVGVPTDTSARGRKLAESRRVLVAAPAYLKSHHRPKAPDDLRRHECLVHGDANASIVWRFGTDPAKSVPVPVRGRFAANNSEAVVLMARQGLGVALLADWLVREDLKRGRLVPLLERFAAPPAPVFALSPPGRFSSATVRALTEHLATTIASRLKS
jgi:DNA-binding transcriptional LysR family regulator